MPRPTIPPHIRDHNRSVREELDRGEAHALALLQAIRRLPDTDTRRRLEALADAAHEGVYNARDRVMRFRWRAVYLPPLPGESEPFCPSPYTRDGRVA